MQGLPVKLSFVLLLLLQHSGSLAAELNNVRISASDTLTRVIMDMSGPVAHELFDLANPDRVVLDLHKTRLGAAKMPTGRGFIKRLRSGTPQKSTLRIVLDLSAAVKMRSYQLTPEEGSTHQLVVELTSQTGRTGDAVKRLDKSQGRKLIIAIDAGHGGIDPGAIGKSGTREKDVVLQIAQKLKKRIDAEAGFEGVLVRTNDSFLLHRERMRIAREHKADLFVSIHADAFKEVSAHGSTVYVLSERGASSEAARWLAERENAADLVGGVSLGDKDDMLASVLLDLSQTATLSASIEVGNHVASQLGKVKRLRKKQVQQANFLVLKSPDVPSILIETAFISNPSEEKRLRQASHQKQWASAIAEGIVQYFHANAPPDSLVAQQQKLSRPQEVIYTVSRGDTLSDIADRFDVRLRYLRKANKIRGDRIRVGQIIRIPQG
ncbi:MAG: LysM peptidoglycan-binding domain-containing protein [Gammaproteobacteria bacterium]|nr:LysM peptidoglycan-binding domain-containing protein [Gammaproteobacteria bacterium]